MTERHLAEWTYNGRKTYDRKDMAPKGQMAKMYQETGIWPKRNSNQKTESKKIGRKPITPVADKQYTE